MNKGVSFLETGIHNTSEIGRLKKVLLHRPGGELENLMPEYLERLLFDDIPYLKEAQREHDAFADCLRQQGVEVVYLRDLVAESITDADVRADLIRQFLEESGVKDDRLRESLEDFLSALPDKEMVSAMMAGVRKSQLRANSARLGDYLSAAGDDYPFAVDPLPNLYFTRDPFATIGTGVSIHRMHTVTRNRETLYGDYVLRHHPDYAGQVPLYYTPDQYFWIEGGDILNLSRRVLGVGISQRTQPEAIEQLASAIFADESSEIDTVLAFEIPSTRAFMHLDTVFTQVDVDKFTVHPGILGTLRIFELTGRGQGKLTTREVSGPLEQVLAGYLGLDRVQLIRCGGSSQIAAEREQWNDGSNTLCIAPGVVVVYDRNYVTNQILEDSGIRVLKMPSAELSRGRGGPRCMSMPLWRDEI